MAKNSEWSEVPENGITLGPEEALLREIEKNKALKVEKLGLKNEIEKLRLENSNLSKENRNLNHKIKQFTPPKPRESSATSGRATPKPLSNFLISIAVTATFILFLFFLFF
jgi:hypothetical protein